MYGPNFVTPPASSPSPAPPASGGEKVNGESASESPFPRRGEGRGEGRSRATAGRGRARSRKHLDRRRIYRRARVEGGADPSLTCRGFGRERLLAAQCPRRLTPAPQHESRQDDFPGFGTQSFSVFLVISVGLPPREDAVDSRFRDVHAPPARSVSAPCGRPCVRWHRRRSTGHSPATGTRGLPV